MSLVTAKRAYDPALQDDGVRILVDRLWPRGMSRQRLRIDAWLPEIAPSNDLRTWFGHDPARWREFKTRYFEELRAKPEAVRALRELVSGKRTTLLFAAKDTQHNQAVALLEFLRQHPQPDA